MTAPTPAAAIEAWHLHRRIDLLIARHPSCPAAVSLLVDRLLIAAEAAEAGKARPPPRR